MKLRKITTPKGLVRFPHLVKPEMYDGSEVGYTIILEFNKEDTDKMMKFLEDELEAAKNSPEFKGKKWTGARLGNKEDRNGNTIFKFKNSTMIRGRDGSMTPRVIPVFDADGRPFVPTTMGNDSVAKVSFSVNPYWKSSTNCGLSLYLQAVQVLKLVEYSAQGNGTADSFGFAKEAGFKAPEDEEVGAEEATVTNSIDDNEEF